MKKLIGFFILCGFFLFSGSAFASFSDIRSGSQLESYIDVLIKKGIISGYPDGSFQPEQTINRAEALKIIFETIEGQLEEGTNSGFPDVPPDEWFAKYVTTAKKKDIIKGYPDGKYRPTQEVNRAEFIKMAVSALPFFDASPKDTSIAIQQYSDVYDLWYTPYVSAGLQLGFLSTTGELKPTAPMQRQDAVEIVYRISKYLEENPSSLAESNIPFVPEESFTIIDPVKSSYSNPELGPDVIIVKKDIGKTEVFQKSHGYNLVLPELIDVWSFTNAPNQTIVQTTDKSCRTILALRGNDTIQDAYEQITNPESYMRPYETTALTRLEKYKNVEAYRVEVIWDDKTWATHLVEVSEGILQIVTEAYNYKSCLEKYPDLILSGMSLR
jgi:hypothetical protein